jgi:hypothetical protein
MGFHMNTNDTAGYIDAIVELEGLPFGEAKLTYKAREKLPDSAFCGPNRTYPAHDPAHIKNAIARLMQIKPKGWKKILKCVCGRAKKAGIESKVCKTGKFMEAKEVEPIVDWFLNKHSDDLCADCGE